jgi:hypothetical protein
MAEEILVKEQLTDRMIAVGKHLLAELENTDLRVLTAFWLYDAELNEWHLTLATPRLDNDGPRKLFFTILEVLQREEEALHGLQLTDVKLLSSNEPLVRAVAGANQSWNGLSGKRLRNTGMNGVHVDDIYIYFVKDSVEPPNDLIWNTF